MARSALGPSYLDCCIIEELSSFVLSRWISDFGCTPPDKYYWLVACLLKVSQDHNLQQTPNMEASTREGVRWFGREGVLHEKPLLGEATGESALGNLKTSSYRGFEQQRVTPNQTNSHQSDVLCTKRERIIETELGLRRFPHDHNQITKGCDNASANWSRGSGIAL